MSLSSAPIAPIAPIAPMDPTSVIAKKFYAIDVLSPPPNDAKIPDEWKNDDTGPFAISISRLRARFQHEQIVSVTIGIRGQIPCSTDSAMKTTEVVIYIVVHDEDWEDLMKQTEFGSELAKEIKDAIESGWMNELPHNSYL